MTHSTQQGDYDCQGAPAEVRVETTAEKIEKLKAEMNKAVAAQEFEQAAKIRDEIKALEEGFSEDDLKAAGEEVAAALKPGEALGDMSKVFDSLDLAKEQE